MLHAIEFATRVDGRSLYVRALCDSTPAQLRERMISYQIIEAFDGETDERIDLDVLNTDSAAEQMHGDAWGAADEQIGTDTHTHSDRSRACCWHD